MFLQTLKIEDQHNKRNIKNNSKKIRRYRGGFYFKSSYRVIKIFNHHTNTKWNYGYLKNNKLFTCEMVDIGYVTMVKNQFMT